MTPASLPPDEAARLLALRELRVLDSAPEPLFDHLARLAATLCGTPIGLLSLVDEHRQWFKANVGLEGLVESPRELSFCAHAILGDGLFVVPDATCDLRFHDNPLVTAPGGVQSYFGAPLVLPDGQRMGTLCVVDHLPRQLSEQQLAALSQLAEVATAALVQRREMLLRSLTVRSEYERLLVRSENRYRRIVEDQSELVSLANADGTLVYANPAYQALYAAPGENLVGRSLFDFIQPADQEAVRHRLAQVLQTGHSVSSENRMLGRDGQPRWVAWTNGMQREDDGAPLLHSVGRDITARKQAEQSLRASQAFLYRTGRVAGVGGWELDLASGAVIWSDETRRIHEVPADHVPTLATAIAFYAPEGRAAIEAAVQAGIQHGQAWDLELPLTTARGRSIWVRVAGEAEFEAGQVVRLVGAFQDITERKQLAQRLADSERFVRQITDSLPVRIAYTDRELRYRFANLAHCQRFGLPRDQILGHSRSELLQGVGDAEIAPRFAAVLAGEAQRFEFDEPVNGQWRRIDTQLMPDLDAQGQVRGFYSTGVDITEGVAARELLLRQAATLQSVTEAIPATIAVVGADSRYLFVNNAFVEWAGRPRAAILGHSVREILGEEEFQRRLPWLERALRGESVSFERELQGRERARHYLVNYLPLRLPSEQVDGFVAVTQDITLQRQEEVRLRQLSQRDALTGLLNRVGFEDELNAVLDEGQGHAMALLYIDLDLFKPVNDLHGHSVGDQVLRLFAQRLQRLVRPTDAVARLGGDEFAIMLAGVRERAHAQIVADKVIQAAQAPFVVGPRQLSVSASVGIAYGAEPDTGWGELVERADAQLYRAKAAGRGRHAGADK